MAEIATSVPEITAVDEPLLSPTHATAAAPSAGGERPPSRVPMLLGLFAGRRGASLIVSQTVALQMEDYREAWGYSFPVVVIETLWNLAFVVVSFATLFWIAREETNLLLRVWICGYVMQCVVNVVVLLLVYKRRNRRVSADSTATIPGFSSSGSSSESDEDRVTRPVRWDMLYTVVSYFWWVLGFIWIVSYDNSVTPRLFGLTLAYLAMDVFFLVLGFLLDCLLSAAYCFCLPCIIAFMYYINRQERASEANISRLPKYKVENVEQPGVRECRMIPMGTNGHDYSTPLAVLTEYAECSICLCRYEDGEQLHLLLCGHHFHSTCIVKWLRLKATCPICKSLVASNEQG
ncbi:putative transcription factor C2H2 family [Helianthus annuus]|nr:putative transcription factor C2H2 family [Helianthus annuus]